jgi:hypothetical protein
VRQSVEPPLLPDAPRPRSHLAANLPSFSRASSWRARTSARQLATFLLPLDTPYPYVIQQWPERDATHEPRRLGIVVHHGARSPGCALCDGGVYAANIRLLGAYMGRLCKCVCARSFMCLASSIKVFSFLVYCWLSAQPPPLLVTTNKTTLRSDGARHSGPFLIFPCLYLSSHCSATDDFVLRSAQAMVRV